jgi:hypothetical protein
MKYIVGIALAGWAIGWLLCHALANIAGAQ